MDSDRTCTPAVTGLAHLTVTGLAPRKQREFQRVSDGGEGGRGEWRKVTPCLQGCLELFVRYPNIVSKTARSCTRWRMDICVVDWLEYDKSRHRSMVLVRSSSTQPKNTSSNYKHKRTLIKQRSDRSKSKSTTIL